MMTDFVLKDEIEEALGARFIAIKLVYPPQLFITLMCFSVACFGCQSFCDVSPYVCSYTFCSVWVAEWPPFGKELSIWLAVCSHCILSIDS